MFTIQTYPYDHRFDHWKLYNDYPCLYILENGKYAYVGYSRDVFQRTDQHIRDAQEEKYHYQRIHLIMSDDFNVSVVTHYEHLLIKIMRIDGKFILCNILNGETKHYYREKNDSELKFDQLFELLQEKKLVKKKDFNQILYSSAYKFYPYHEVTKEQNKALTSIIHTLDSGELISPDKRHLNRPMVISGYAGTGKTVVASVLYAYLKSSQLYQEKKIALVVPNTPTRDEAQKIFQALHLDSFSVISPNRVAESNYDILICDEAHKLRRDVNLGKYRPIFLSTNKKLGLDKNGDELDWLLKQSKILILFYDKGQIVCPSEIPNTIFTQKLLSNNRGIRPIELKQQLRTSQLYVSYVYDILYQRAKEKVLFSDYDFRLYVQEDALDFQEKMDDLIEHIPLSRYCGGYAWPWSKDKDVCDVCFGQVKLKWNSKRAGWIRSKKCNHEFGSIYSLSGIDANYLGVVIGNDLYFDEQEQKIRVNREFFYDSKVSQNICDQELLECVLNTYGVLLTRATKGTYVYVCDEALRNYLKQYIEIAD